MTYEFDLSVVLPTAHPRRVSGHVMGTMQHRRNAATGRLLGGASRIRTHGRLSKRSVSHLKLSISQYRSFESHALLGQRSTVGIGGLSRPRVIGPNCSNVSNLSFWALASWGGCTGSRRALYRVEYFRIDHVFTLRFAVEYVVQIAHRRYAHSFKRLGHIRQHIDLRPRLNPAVTEKTDP